MQIFKQRIQGIAEGKAIFKTVHNKEPKVGYQYLAPEQQASLILALVNEDSEAHEYISKRITNALLDAYQEQTKSSEAEDDAIDLARFRQEDAASRGRDMRQAMGGR